MGDDDFALLDQWGSGDRGAGNTLLMRHFDTVYRFFVSKIGNDTEVDDLIQRVFLACVESRERFRREASFRTFLLTVARHELFRHFRQSRTRGARSESLGSMSVVELGSSVRAAMVRREEERLLLSALREIPVDLQITIELHYWEGLTTAELSTVLEIPQGTVKSRLRRAREALHEAMARISEDAATLESTISDFEHWAGQVRERVAQARGQG
ncbi:MAG: RNA polymerase sigma factor [Nannocystales bacterium]